MDELKIKRAKNGFIIVLPPVKTGIMKREAGDTFVCRNLDEVKQKVGELLGGVGE